MAKVHVRFNGSPEELWSILARKLCLVFYSGGCPSVWWDGQTRATAFQLFVCCLQTLHVTWVRVLRSPGMNPSGWSLEYSLHNPGEGRRNGSASALLPCEQTYGRGAP